jgi:DNA (cytosine-5)-methyltransferase 1
MAKYVETLDRMLPPPSSTNFTNHVVLDLFAGCGGLALGFEAAGFHTIGFEMDEDACATYNANLAGSCRQVYLEPGMDLAPHADVIIGGPPCQPFSVVGNQNGHRDDRDGFPTFLDAVERYQPRLALFENVRGMLYRNRAYFNHIVSQLKTLKYVVWWSLINASHHGVPQNRERLIVVAHRGGWSAPKRHPEKPVTAGEALDGLLQKVPEKPRFLTASMDEYVARYEARSQCVRPRDLHLNAPSRTVTCRNLYGATADMLRLRLEDGRRRMLTVREAARIQSFPDRFVFNGSENSQFQQIGNAVPPLLARTLADAVREALKATELPFDRIYALNREHEQLSLGL